MIETILSTDRSPRKQSINDYRLRPPQLINIAAPTLIAGENKPPIAAKMPTMEKKNIVTNPVEKSTPIEKMVEDVELKNINIKEEKNNRIQLENNFFPTMQ